MKPVCVFDFETDSLDIPTLNPVEVACIILDQHTLDPIPGSEFCSDMRPENIDEPDYLTSEARKSTIDWHCKMNKCKVEELLAKWRTFPPADTVWNLFVKHVNKYNKGNTNYDAPYPAGQNIVNFDLPIAQKLNARYKVQRLFNNEVIDLRHISFYTLVWDNELKSRSMDKLREYFGLPNEKAHTALMDVQQEGQVISRFLKYFKAGFKKDKFKGSMANGEVKGY